MRGTVNEEVTDPQERAEALAFLEQSEDFFSAASGGLAANPLVLYYAFLNLGKALIRVRGYTGSLDQAMHGLKEETTPGGTELKDSSVIAKDSGSNLNIYPELVERLGYPRPATADVYPVVELLPQVVIGHRIWRESQIDRNERFIDIKEIQFVDDRQRKELWLRLFIERSDLERYEITHARLLTEGHLDGVFREVNMHGIDRSSSLICLEQAQVTPYTGRPTDVVADIVAHVRPALWRIVSAIPGDGYRRYYVHLTPPTEARLPQLASLWALFFYFGSVVRYRPHLFDQLLASEDGAFVSEFITSQGEQLLYLLASELCRREIARPAIV